MPNFMLYLDINVRSGCTFHLHWNYKGQRVDCQAVQKETKMVENAA